AAFALSLWAGGMLNSWEAITFDLRARILARPGAATDDIRIILLDQKSLDFAQKEFGLGWPWPRQAYVPIVDFCREANATSLSFDVVFTEPSVYGVSDDQMLGNAMKRFGRVIRP
ncbi:MAG: CHASE2 domain-containing protein, partial [Planctomycetes bacterium]|nr:CHASE2 domain-containing protein [Planctomycetota bacterium]